MTTKDFGFLILLRFYLLCFLIKTAVAIPLKKSRKRKINVFLRGSCFGFTLFCQKEKRIKKRQSRYDFAVLYLRFRKDYSAGFSSALGASAAGASALGAAAAAGAAGFASAAGAAGLLPVITPFGHLFAQMPQDLHLL